MPRRRVTSVCSTTSTPMVMMATATTERCTTGRTNSPLDDQRDGHGHGDAEEHRHRRTGSPLTVRKRAVQ